VYIKVRTNAANAIKMGTQLKNWVIAIQISIYEVVGTTMNVVKHSCLNLNLLVMAMGMLHQAV
jgi:hypothetical protein